MLLPTITLLAVTITSDGERIARVATDYGDANVNLGKVTSPSAELVTPTVAELFNGVQKHFNQPQAFAVGGATKEEELAALADDLAKAKAAQPPAPLASFPQ